MAHPDIQKAREARNKAHADVVAQLTRTRVESGRALMHGKHHIPTVDLLAVENAIDDLKGALVHYANACSTVDFLEES